MHNRRVIFGFFSHAFQKNGEKKWYCFEDSRSTERTSSSHTHCNDDRCGFRWVTAADGAESPMNRADILLYTRIILYSCVCVCSNSVFASQSGSFPHCPNTNTNIIIIFIVILYLYYVRRRFDD